ncbi:hypothetical protein F7725_008799 [Dissostichus mawsoni]|uniref:Uncharacterized protein n=1 Tax=Dissostichus mawsoni TaxID=36200 RepID=A0A7J5Y865_DISMA|nr:hypothetical protein F7725_008799 [Dissostichus mawsoni]
MESLIRPEIRHAPLVTTANQRRPRQDEERRKRKEEEKPVAMTTSRWRGSSCRTQGPAPPPGPRTPPREGPREGRAECWDRLQRRGRRGRPPKLAVTMATAEQLAERRRERLHEVTGSGDQELVEALLLDSQRRSVDGGAATRFPDMYREFESLQAQVARSLGILDEVNRMKVLPGSSPSLTNKSVRYLEVSSPAHSGNTHISYLTLAQLTSVSQNSKMLPPSKRFKMENRVQQNGVTGPVFGPSGSSPLKSEQIYLQTGGLTVQPGDRMVILNGPDGTTLQIQTPEGVPLDGVPLEGVPLEALLGIEAPQ